MQNVQIIPALPEQGFLRVWQVIGCKKRKITPLIPIGKTAWLKGVKSGHFPAPVKIMGARAVAWRAKDIQELLKTMGGEVCDHTN